MGAVHRWPAIRLRVAVVRLTFPASPGCQAHPMRQSPRGKVAGTRTVVSKRDRGTRGARSCTTDTGGRRNGCGGHWPGLVGAGRPGSLRQPGSPHRSRDVGCAGRWSSRAAAVRALPADGVPSRPAPGLRDGDLRSRHLGPSRRPCRPGHRHVRRHDDLGRRAGEAPGVLARARGLAHLTGGDAPGRPPDARGGARRRPS